MNYQAKQHQIPDVSLPIHYKFPVITYTHSAGRLQGISDAMQAKKKRNCCMSVSLCYYQWEIIISAVYWSEN